MGSQSAQMWEASTNDDWSAEEDLEEELRYRREIVDGVYAGMIEIHKRMAPRWRQLLEDYAAGKVEIATVQATLLGRPLH